MAECVENVGATLLSSTIMSYFTLLVLFFEVQSCLVRVQSFFLLFKLLFPPKQINIIKSINNQNDGVLGFWGFGV